MVSRGRSSPPVVPDVDMPFLEWLQRMIGLDLSPAPRHESPRPPAGFSSWPDAYEDMMKQRDAALILRDTERQKGAGTAL